MKHEQQETENPEKNTTYLDMVFSALSSPIRRAIIELVSASEYTVNDLYESIKTMQFNTKSSTKSKSSSKKEESITREAISQHLHILIDAGLIDQTKSGRIRNCNLNPKPLSNAFNWIVRYRIFWENLLDDIQERVDAETDNNEEN